jgi:hypothetical protein
MFLRSLPFLLALAVMAVAQVPPPQQPPFPQPPPLPGSGLPGATPTPPTSPIWKCTLPGGTYEVALRSITAVSSHEYVIDAGVRVTEVNVATSASMLVRFYYIEPAATGAAGPAAALADKAQSLATEALNRTGVDVWKKVVKNYPTTTHAHTVEYRLESKDSLLALFASVEQAFRLQKPGAFQGE